MAIDRISRHEFDGYKPTRYAISESTLEETDWYSDANGNIIGSVFRDRTDNDWGYVIFGLDERAHFRGIALESCVATEGGARNSLLAAMKTIEASGQTEFPQDDDSIP